MTKDKTKEYKRFNFPNELSDFEQYYYYLNEFEFIPKKMPPYMIKTIFDATAQDFIEGHLTYEKFLYIFELLYYDYVMGQVGLDKKMENLMDGLVYDLDTNLYDEKKHRFQLENYFK